MCARAWPLGSCLGPHPTAPGHRAAPAPRCAGCAATAAAGHCCLSLLPPRLPGDPRCAPGSKAPRRSSSPSRGRGGKGGWCGSLKNWSPQPASPAQGWAARSEVCDCRSQLLAEPGRSELAAGLEPPQLEGEARCVRLERPSAATSVCPPSPVLPRLIGVHGAGAVAPFRAHSDLRRRIGASPPAWRCWQKRGTPGHSCSQI